jgi:hypothetical protein
VRGTGVYLRGIYDGSEGTFNFNHDRLHTRTWRASYSGIASLGWPGDKRPSATRRRLTLASTL